MNNIGQLEERINYRFSDISLLDTALTHSSFIKEHSGTGKSNERLEFLGDAFLDAVIGEELFRIFPDREEGFLSKVRATLVCEKTLAREARKIELGKFLMLGNGEARNGGRERESILADAMEAVLGSVYIDGGFENVRKVVLGVFREAIEDAKHGKYVVVDYKTALQEKLQSRGVTDIHYELIRETGPDHDKTFYVQLRVNNEPMTKGKGKSKKQAEQQAAEAMLEKEI